MTQPAQQTPIQLCGQIANLLGRLVAMRAWRVQLSDSRPAMFRSQGAVQFAFTTSGGSEKVLDANPNRKGVSIRAISGVLFVQVGGNAGERRGIQLNRFAANPNDNFWDGKISGAVVTGEIWIWSSGPDEIVTVTEYA